MQGKNAQTRDRTGDLQIFSLTLSQLSYRGGQQRHSGLIEPIDNFAFLRNKIRKKMDLSGFEPEAFCMQSRRDTTTPQAQNALEIRRKQQSSKVVSHREI